MGRKPPKPGDSGVEPGHEGAKTLSLATQCCPRLVRLFSSQALWKVQAEGEKGRASHSVVGSNLEDDGTWAPRNVNVMEGPSLFYSRSNPENGVISALTI